MGHESGRGHSRKLLPGGALIAALAFAVFCSATPALGAEPWNAVWIGQCCATEKGAIVEMETGETRWSAFLAKNTGLSVWKSTGSIVAHLGTAEGRDRQSKLFYPGPGEGAWISANRPAGLATASVGPGSTGTFRFRVLAPGAPGDYKEYFEPVADGTNNGWMGSTIASGCYPDRWCGGHLIYRVKTAAPPEASFTSAPATVGRPFRYRLSVDATDNVGLDRVVATIDGDPASTQVDDLPAPDANAFDPTQFGFAQQLFKSHRSELSFAPSGCGWQRGEHTVKVVAYDLLGQVDRVTKTFTVLPDGDCDGVPGRRDKCPSLPSLSPDDGDGCPPPRGRAAGNTDLSVRAGNGPFSGVNRVVGATIRQVLAGTHIEAFCEPSCGQPIKQRVGKDRRLLWLGIGKTVRDGSRVVIRATLPRPRNFYGRQWKWLVKDGSRSQGGECLKPGLAGKLGC